MKTLVFGGTGFVGRHLVDALRNQGATITIVNRGRTDASVFPDVERVIADRDGDLSALAGRSWDRVYDTSGYEPKSVRASLRVTGDAPYVYVSSVSVYTELGADEHGPTHAPEEVPLAIEKYGALKVACEKLLPDSASIIRAGLILGPYDYDRRLHWLMTRIRKGGEMIAPGSPDAPAQFVDVRDLGAFMIGAPRGTFNVTGQPISMRALFEGIREVVGGDAKFKWVPDDVLLKHDVKPYSEMPFWLPASLGAKPFPIEKALAEGLRHRPFMDTLHDAWNWMVEGWSKMEHAREIRPLKTPAGIDPARERAILDSCTFDGS